ncbi:hypothetical protein KAU11_10450 [Candidatus Babeliales bacterium]|nr:hypothetical protein [Candidatus Babeliales bacterium]
MTGHKEITPKVHLFDILDPVDCEGLLGFNESGSKFQVPIKPLVLLIEELKIELEELKEEVRVLKEIKEESGSKKTTCIFDNKSIEKNGVVGTIYTDGVKVRVKLKDRWVSI